VDYGHTVPVDFASASITHIDEEIDVTDSYYGFLGTVSALNDALPKYFYYTRTIDAPTGECGIFEVDNIADFVTNDTGATGSDDATVVIDVPCPEGCTPGFWQGGAGSQLWNVVNDPQWTYGGTNPFIHTTLFNDYFNAGPTDARLNDLTMYDLVSSGGTSDSARRAARDMVAAYLNESAFGNTFAATSLDDLKAMWYAAVVGGDAALDAFHNEVSGWNDSGSFGGYCPLP